MAISQSLVMIARLIRVKFAAIFLGVEGVGLVSLYFGNIDLIKEFAGFGMHQSGVRSLASSDSVSELEKIKSILLSYFFSAAVLVLITISITSQWLAEVLLGNPELWSTIILLALLASISLVTSHATQLLQSQRKVSSIARLNVIIAIVSSIVCALFYSFYGVDGILWSMLMNSIISIGIHYLTIRNSISKKFTFILSNKNRITVYKLLGLGGALMWNSLLVLGVAQATRVFLNHLEGISAVAYYSAAFSLSALFLNFILSAMSTDYYPSLCKVANKPKEANDLANNQLEIGIYLSLTGLILTLLFAPEALYLAYDKGFEPALQLLQLLCLGCAFRVLNWPLGFFVLAHNKSKLFVIIQTVFQLIHLIGAYIGYKLYGLNGIPLGFIAMNIAGMFFMQWITRTKFSYKGNSKTLFATILFISTMIITYYAKDIFGRYNIFSIICKGAVVSAIGACCLLKLTTLLGIKNFSDLKKLKNA